MLLCFRGVKYSSEVPESRIDSNGVRVPDCDFIRTVSQRSGGSLALISANLSGHPSSVCIKDF